MSIYRRDVVSPEWEPTPYNLAGPEADEQELGFHARATKSIEWALVPYRVFPEGGIFEHDRAWFSEHDIECYATLDGEDLILIRNLWHGFPDPPEWGLASRPSGRSDIKWREWGYVPDLPKAWIVPVRDTVPMSD